MARPNAAEIVEVCMVAPPPAVTPDHSFTPLNCLPLTFFDIQWLRSPPIQRLYFYETPKTTSFMDSILPTLKHSLSLTLHHFLPLTGNLTWPPTSPKPVVAFALGDAVSLTVAKSYADFYRLSGSEGNEFWEATEYHHLQPKLAASQERAKVLAIQLTFFPESGGFSIGIAASHAVLDGKSLNLFIKSWSHIGRSRFSSSSGGGDEYCDQSPPLLPPELKPIYEDRTLVKEPAKLEAIFSPNQELNRSLLPSEPIAAPDSVKGTFRFSLEKIEKLRRRILTANMNDEKDRRRPHMSSLSLTCAYTWVCLVKAEGRNQNGTLRLLFPVDCRSRLYPPLSTSYFGNCIGLKFVVVERETIMGEQGFVLAVNAISEAIISLDDNINGILSDAENRVLSVTSSKVDKSTRRIKAQLDGLYPVNDSSRFEVYSTDFGWGKPKKVDVDNLPAMVLTDSRDGDGGVEVGLVLKKYHMEAFASLFVQGIEEKKILD